MDTACLYEGQFLRMVREGHWEYAQRVKANGAVMIVAVTPERELVLVEQYRIPIHADCIELPAGISGDVGGTESFIESARRELSEETGFDAGSWTFLFTGPSSPGLATEMVHFFLAEDLRQISEGGGVDNEKITVHRIPIDGIDTWLAEQSAMGKIIDPRVFTGLYFLVRPHANEK